jgi:short-subunit dehydrogenase
MNTRFAMVTVAADRCRQLGAAVTAVQTDLAAIEGVDELWAAAAGRPVDALLANAGHGLGHAFLDQAFTDVRHVIDTGIHRRAGATETDFFERADMLDTQVGQSAKDDPADVARVGYDAMMRGDGDVVSGWKNKIQTAIATGSGE